MVVMAWKGELKIHEGLGRSPEGPFLPHKLPGLDQAPAWSTLPLKAKSPISCIDIGSLSLSQWDYAKKLFSRNTEMLIVTLARQRSVYSHSVLQSFTSCRMDRKWMRFAKSWDSALRSRAENTSSLHEEKRSRVFLSWFIASRTPTVKEDFVVSFGSEYDVRQLEATFYRLSYHTVVRNERLSTRRTAIQHRCAIVVECGPFSRLRGENLRPCRIGLVKGSFSRIFGDGISEHSRPFPFSVRSIGETI